MKWPFAETIQMVKRKTSSEVCPGHGREWLVLPLPLAFHFPDKGIVVLSDGHRVGVLWPQLLLIDGQGTLVQRFGLLVLALSTVESCQAIEAGGRVRMQWPQLLLSDRQS